MTLDEARLRENVNARAQLLFEHGYRARWMGRHALQIRNGRGGAYHVDTQSGGCDCPFFRGYAGRHRFVTILLLRAWADIDDASNLKDAISLNATAEFNDAAVSQPEVSHAQA